MSTLDVWRAFSNDFAHQQNISGSYGVDFRSPQPSVPHRRVLRMLAAANALEPRMLSNTINRIDWDQSSTFQAYQTHGIRTRTLPNNDGYQRTSGLGQEAENSTTPRGETDTDVETVPESDSEMATDHDVLSDVDFDTGTRTRRASMSSPFPHAGSSQHQRRFVTNEVVSPIEEPPHISRRRAPSAPSAPSSVTAYPLPAQRMSHRPSNPTHGFDARPTFPHQSQLRPPYARRPAPTGPASESGLPMSLPSLGIAIPNRAAKSEPDTNTNLESGDRSSFQTGPYGYRYPVHPPYPSQSQSQSQMPTPTASSHISLSNAIQHDSIPELVESEPPPALVQAHPSTQSHHQLQSRGLVQPSQSMGLDYSQGQDWTSFQPHGALAGSSGVSPPCGGGVESWNSAETGMDVDLGGWGRVSDPLPGMQLEMLQPAIHPQEPVHAPESQIYGEMAYAQGRKFGQDMSPEMSNYGSQQQMNYYVSGSQPMSLPSYGYGGWRT